MSLTLLIIIYKTLLFETSTPDRYIKKQSPECLKASKPVYCFIDYYYTPQSILPFHTSKDSFGYSAELV